MNNLTFELIKNCTTLVKLTHLNDLCNKLTDTNSDVYALRADFGYPEHLIPKNNKKILAYMGISKNKVDTTYGQAHFITFTHEPKLSIRDAPVGILRNMYNIYMDEKIEELVEDGYKEGENFSVELFPQTIDRRNVGYWRWVLEDDWGVSDQISMNDLIDDYEIKRYIDWADLYNILPENIDDIEHHEADEDDEGEYDLDGDLTEEEEGEYISESET